MTAEGLSALAGVILSLAFSYVPALAPWYEKQTPTRKRGLMALLLLLVAAGALLYDCRGNAACMAADWQKVVSVLIAALVANQSAYLLSPNK